MASEILALVSKAIHTGLIWDCNMRRSVYSSELLISLVSLSVPQLKVLCVAILEMVCHPMTIGCLRQQDG